ncbi:MAG TPA: hypothetical protein VJW20_08020 [Candidatus Angelobacter sp.]|nr:hypothetical protein [Candidatus Angelobacter sp.]
MLQPWDAQQPDEELFDRAMQSFNQGHRQEAKTLLETLVCTYPDSAYSSRASLALEDMWYSEAGIGARPEIDMGVGEKITFFPPLKESADIAQQN